jgi:hypothetical protein
MKQIFKTKQNKNNFYSNRIVLGFALIFMIPKTDSVLAKPNYGGGTLGKGRSAAWNMVATLKYKRYVLNIPLTEAEQKDLEEQENLFNKVYNKVFGPLSLIKSTTPQYSLDSNDMVLQQPEQSSQINPRIQCPIFDGKLAKRPEYFFLIIFLFWIINS